VADMTAVNLPGELPRYRQALGSFLTGVTVITTRDADGNDRGMTANSFTSVSLDPPLVLFCIDRRAASHPAFTAAPGYAVHILGSHQQDLAALFASKSPDKFAGLEISRSSTGMAILADAHAVLDCSAHDVVDAGDHAVVIARVEAFAVRDVRPLGFYQGKMASFHAEDELAALAAAGTTRPRVLWLLETLSGGIVLRDSATGATLPESSVPTGDLHDERLAAAATATIEAPVAVDFLYSVYGSASDTLTLVYRGRVDPAGSGYALAQHHRALPANTAALAVTDDTERAVLERYVAERGDLSFGIYAGSIDTGSVATIAGQPH
jgi:flavin-dependent trigonelline monooxygenase, reductase component